jgi:hypothetical protein
MEVNMGHLVGTIRDGVEVTPSSFDGVAPIPCGTGEVGCGQLVGPDNAQGLLLMDEGSMPVAWCLSCVGAMTPAQADEVHDEAEEATWHDCEVATDDTFYGDGGFCRWCGTHLSNVGSAGFIPYLFLSEE